MTKSPTPGQLRWYASDRLRAIGSEQCKKLNRERQMLPRCGAMARTSGEPCKQAAMANGRCRWHGGRVGSGSEWHRPRWPDKNDPDATAKLNRKLKDLAKRAKLRDARLAAMSPEERAAHAEWKRTHKPGDPKRRAADRERRRQDAEGRALMRRSAGEPKALSAEEEAVADELASLRRERDEMQARTFHAATYRTGVFE